MNENTDTMSLRERALDKHHKAVYKARAAAQDERAEKRAEALKDLERALQRLPGDYTISWRDDDRPFALIEDLIFGVTPRRKSGHYTEGEELALYTYCPACDATLLVSVLVPRYDRESDPLDALGYALASERTEFVIADHQRGDCEAIEREAEPVSARKPEPSPAERLAAALLDLLADRGLVVRRSEDE